MIETGGKNNNKQHLKNKMHTQKLTGKLTFANSTFSNGIPPTSEIWKQKKKKFKTKPLTPQQEKKKKKEKQIQPQISTEISCFSL